MIKEKDTFERANNIKKKKKRTYYPKDYDKITEKITRNNSMILDYLYRISKIEKNG